MAIAELGALQVELDRLELELAYRKSTESLAVATTELDLTRAERVVVSER